MNRYKNNYYWIYSRCICNSGYYDNGNQYCPPCNYNCVTCVSSSNNCQTCGAYRTSAPACNCLTKYYDLEYSKNCIACHYSCSTCSSGSSCDTCNAGYYR